MCSRGDGNEGQIPSFPSPAEAQDPGRLMPPERVQQNTPARGTSVTRAQAGCRTVTQ